MKFLKFFKFVVFYENSNLFPGRQFPFILHFSTFLSKVEKIILKVVEEVTNSVGQYEIVIGVSPLIVPLQGDTIKAFDDGVREQLKSNDSFPVGRRVIVLEIDYFW